MPRIPNHQYDDEWDDPEEFDIEHDDPKDRFGRKMPRQERDWEEQRREQWRKRNREDY
jgi:hypothetical protein